MDALPVQLLIKVKMVMKAVRSIKSKQPGSFELFRAVVYN